MTDLNETPQRFAVVGTSCAGKTTFAAKLSAILDVPHVELDRIYWQPGWAALEKPAFRARVASALEGERWVVDGNYSVVRDIVWNRATTLVWLDYPFPIVFGRGLTRTVRRIATREELFSGNRESFVNSFLSFDSILVWILKTHWSHRARYRRILDAGEYPHLAVVRLRSPRETGAHLEALARETRVALRRSREASMA